jgi:hypothetical protein
MMFIPGIPRGADPGVGGRDRDELGDLGADDPRHLPGVARHLERHPVDSAEALGKQLERLRRHLDPPGRTNLAALGDRDLGEVAVDVETYRSHPLHLLTVIGVGAQLDNDSDVFVLRAQPGAATEKPGSRPIAQETACPACVLQKPLSQSAGRRSGPGRQLSGVEFHTPKGSCLRGLR